MQQRNLRVLVAASLVTQPIYGLLWSLQGPFLRTQNFSGTLYGIVASTAVFSSIVGSLLSGYFSDKKGAKPVLVLAILGSSLGMLIFSHGGLAWVLVASAILGASMGAGYVSLVALLSKSVSDSELDKGFSYVTAASTIGVGIGSFLGWIPELLAKEYGYFHAYQITLITASIALPVAALPFISLLAEPERRSKKEASPPPKRILGTFIKLSLIEFIIGFGAALSVQNIDYYFVLKYGVKSGELGTVFGTEQVIMGILMLAMPRVSRAAGGPLRAYIAITSPSIPLILAMTFVDNYAIASALFITRSILMNVASPLYQAFQMQLLPPEYRGRGSAILGLAWQVPVGIGRGVGGYLLDIDVELPLRITSILYTLALGLLAALFPEHIRRKARTRN